MELQNLGFDAKGLSTAGIYKKLTASYLEIEKSNLKESDADFLTMAIIDVISGSLTKIDAIKIANADELKSLAKTIEISKDKTTSAHAGLFDADINDMAAKTNKGNEDKNILKQKAGEHRENMLKKLLEIMKLKKEKKETKTDNEIKNSLASLKENSQDLALKMETLRQEANEVQRKFALTYARMFTLLSYKDKEAHASPSIAPATTPRTP
jgi:hypothetical protein